MKRPDQVTTDPRVCPVKGLPESSRDFKGLQGATTQDERGSFKAEKRRRPLKDPANRVSRFAGHTRMPGGQTCD